MSQSTEEMQGAPVQTGVANPFPGLRPFKIEESHLFFGREGQSDEVLLKLSKSRFVGVIGPSGSGKSSFIYCGVLPILYGGFLTDTSPNWEVVVTRPGAGPIDNLAESLLKTSRDYNNADPEDRKIKRTIVSTLLRSSSLGLVEAIQQLRRSEDVNYLVLVDQFEELFRFKDSTDPNSVNETLAFVNLLMEAINYTDNPIYIAITMRSDFIGECAQFPELTRKINDSHYLIPQMTRDQKRRAIEGPVAVGGAEIAPRLVQQLLNDLGDNPDQLPILQHALMRTWSYWANYKDYEGENVDLKHYEAIGTMAEALSQHANEAYEELEEDQKRICEIIFKAITEKRGENFGIRRPTRLNEIASIADVSEADVIAVLEKFREPGRSLLTPAYGTTLGSKSMIDISHESLMRIWVRLKNWVDDEAEAVQMYLRLAEAASMYQVGKAGLWRPPDLQLALNWQVKHKPTLVWGQRYQPAFERTMIFLEYSKKEFETEQRIKELEQKRKLQRARVIALVLGSFLVLALGAMVYAFYQQTEAKKQEKLAKEQSELAIKNEKEAKKQTTAALKAKKEADDQRKLADKARIEADKSAADAIAAKGVAVAQKTRAELSEADAKDKKKLAETQTKLAVAAKKSADSLAIIALTRQYLSTARSMAVKSKELDNDPEQEALIAQQAYIFNHNHEGYPFDNDIYNGLFRALKHKEINDPLTQNLEGHEKGAARALVTYEKGNQIFSGGSDGKIIRWSMQNGKWTPQELVGARQNIYQVFALDVSMDGKWLAAGGLAEGDATLNFIELYDLQNITASPKKISGFVLNVDNIEFTRDSKGFFTRDNAGRSIKYCDLSTVKEVITSKQKITDIELSPDGNRIAGTASNGILYSWDIKNNYAVKEIYKNPSGAEFTTLAYSPDYNTTRKIVLGDIKGLLRIVTEDTSLPPKILSGHLSHIEQIRFNHAGEFMATTSRDGTARLWNWNDPKQEPIVMKDQPEWVWSATFSPDDEQLMVGIHSNAEKAKETIHVWPTKIETMAGLLCKYVKRNINSDEWNNFVGNLDYEKTCENYPANNK